MSNLKCLSSPFRYNDNQDRRTSIKELEQFNKEIPPIIGKDGWYLKGDLCWYEYYGRAFIANDKKHFIYSLNLLDDYQKYSSSYNVLCAMFKQNSKLMSKKQIRIMYSIKSTKELKEIRIRVHKDMNEWLKNIDS